MRCWARSTPRWCPRAVPSWSSPTASRRSPPGPRSSDSRTTDDRRRPVEHPTRPRLPLPDPGSRRCRPRRRGGRGPAGPAAPLGEDGPRGPHRAAGDAADDGRLGVEVVDGEDSAELLGVEIPPGSAAALALHREDSDALEAIGELELGNRNSRALLGVVDAAEHGLGVLAALRPLESEPFTAANRERLDALAGL